MHNYYRLAGEKTDVRKELLSDYQLRFVKYRNFSIGKKKLIPNLGNKRKYKFYYQNLKLHFSLWLQLKKNHRILEFKREPFLKPYIECNRDLLRETEKEGNKIKKPNAKSRNNAIFGKSIENPMTKFDVKVVNSRIQYLKWSFRLTFKREKQFLNGAIATEKQKCSINLNKTNSSRNKHIRFK